MGLRLDQVMIHEDAKWRTCIPDLIQMKFLMTR